LLAGQPLKDATLMVHFMCDLCGKDLTAEGETRFVVKISVYAGTDPNRLTEADLDDDHMEAVAQILQREETAGSDAHDAAEFKGFRFDLCPSCRLKFVTDPLSRDAERLLDFSEN
jgi:hypothetical protein